MIETFGSILSRLSALGPKTEADRAGIAEPNGSAIGIKGAQTEFKAVTIEIMRMAVDIIDRFSHTASAVSFR